jgi:hypothetical protein
MFVVSAFEKIYKQSKAELFAIPGSKQTNAVQLMECVCVCVLILL